MVQPTPTPVSESSSPEQRSPLRKPNLYWTVTHQGMASLALLIFLVDRGIKAWMELQFGEGESIALIPQIFHITLVHNTGVAFSLLSNLPHWVLAIVSAALIGGLFGFTLLQPRLHRPEQWGFGLILGGALGNMVDRVFVGTVIDYLDVVAIHFPVFNWADMSIFFGVCCLSLYYVQELTQPPNPKNP